MSFDGEDAHRARNRRDRRVAPQYDRSGYRERGCGLRVCDSFFVLFESLNNRWPSPGTHQGLRRVLVRLQSSERYGCQQGDKKCACLGVEL